EELRDARREPAPERPALSRSFRRLDRVRIGVDAGRADDLDLVAELLQPLRQAVDVNGLHGPALRAVVVEDQHSKNRQKVRRTFQSCGSSSRCVRRRKRPTFVSRGSLNPTQSCGPPFSASAIMVRNFTSWKMWPSLPTRSCRNSAGPGLVSLTIIIARSSSG